MKIAILHYSMPPVVGGVEAVIQAHAKLMVEGSFKVKLIGGVGEQKACPQGTELVLIPEMDSQNPRIIRISQELEAGNIPDEFEEVTARLETELTRTLSDFDTVIVHNILTKHFNLPLTIAITRLLEKREIQRCIGWCHDLTWTSEHSRSSVHPGYPWESLRTYRPEVTYVTISRERQEELVGLFNCLKDRIQVIYDGVDPEEIYSLTDRGKVLAKRMKLEEAGLILLMPVRITQAKNIEFAMHVMAELKRRNAKPKLVITGPPDPHDPNDIAYYQSLLELRKQLELEEEVCFVYESGDKSGAGLIIDLPVVRGIYRLCDVLFMPSHREGFGMPILEAGMMGMPIISRAIPATEEIGGEEVIKFSDKASADEVAGIIMDWAEESTTLRLRQRIRRNYTWQAIFSHDILPLLRRGEAA